MKKHPLDPISLVFGALFAALGLFLVVSDARWEAASPAWVLPGLLVVIGGAILWSTFRQLRGGTEEGTEQDQGGEALVADESVEYPIPDVSDL